jgi:dipeptidyl-peptidase-4
MHRIILLLLVSVPLFAQKKPVTLESLNQGGRGGGGSANWAPDGKTFVFRQRQSLMIYNPATRTSRELVSTESIDAAAVKPPPETGPFDWTNRRARVTGGIQWSDDAKAILYESSGDLFLIHLDTGKWDQITKTPEIELDPQLSPDGRMVAFRREYDLYSIDIAAQKETRLTKGGTPTLINGGLDWVYPEELDLSTAFWWSPDSKSIAYLQFDSSREPLYPHEDMLGLRAIYEPERYPQAGEDNADVHMGIVPAAGGSTRWLEVDERLRHPHQSHTKQAGDVFDQCRIRPPRDHFQGVRSVLDQPEGRRAFSGRRQAVPVDERARHRLQSNLSVFERRPRSEATDQRRGLGGEGDRGGHAGSRVLHLG